MTGRGFPGGVEDEPPDLSSDGELGLAVDDLAASRELERDNVHDDEVALLYELMDVLEEYVDNGDVHPDSAAGHLEALAWTAQDAQGIPDELILRERFGVDVDELTFVGREASITDRFRAALARRVSP